MQPIALPRPAFRLPWNKGRLVGPKLALKPKQV